MNGGRVVKRIILVLLVSSYGCALAEEIPKQPVAPGIESEGYVWNEMKGEKLKALKAAGDAIRGEISYEVCAGCHEAGAQGRADGTFPRLAGQHATVLIKQMTDVRAGRRDNPKMYPFADKHVISTQDIADIALYLESLPVTPDNGHGPGVNLPMGKKLYEDDCEECHRPHGQGSSTKFYPRVSGQHYKYLLREAFAIRDGERRNANPDMVKVIKNYNSEEIRAVSDYMSRFPITEE